MRITRTDHRSVVHPSRGLTRWRVTRRGGPITSRPTAYFNIVERAAKENLWRGSSNAFSFTQVVKRWGMKRSILSMELCQSSNTGRWEHVGHYTQMVWRNT